MTVELPPGIGLISRRRRLRKRLQHGPGPMWNADLGGGLGARIETNLGRIEQMHVNIHPL
jgi:hypothetical protein